jgi:hypothetical protein
VEALNRIRRAIDDALKTLVIPLGRRRNGAVDIVCEKLAEVFEELAPPPGFTCAPALPGVGKTLDDLPEPFLSPGATFVYHAGRLLLPTVQASQFNTAMRKVVQNRSRGTDLRE